MLSQLTGRSAHLETPANPCDDAILDHHVRLELVVRVHDGATLSKFAGVGTPRATSVRDLCFKYFECTGESGPESVKGRAGMRNTTERKSNKRRDVANLARAESFCTLIDRQSMLPCSEPLKTVRNREDTRDVL
jgi:hypothetical protein